MDTPNLDILVSGFYSHLVSLTFLNTWLLFGIKMVSKIQTGFERPFKIQAEQAMISLQKMAVF